MNSSVESAPEFLQMTGYAFWALTLALMLLTLFVFQRQRSLQESGINKGAWFVIGLAVLLQVGALSLGGRLVSLIFHVVSLITVCAGLLIFGVYASILLVTGRSRKHDVSG